MKVLGICGSARRGNTEQMLNWVLDSCRAEGAGTKLVRLSDLKIGQCSGCDICLGDDVDCCIEDDMAGLINALLDADIIVLGSPNYFTNVSGDMKTFMDRTQPLYDNSRLRGKVCAAVCVGARPIEETKKVESAIREYFRIMKVDVEGAVCAKAEDIGDVSAQEPVRVSCVLLGKKLVASVKK